MNFKCLNFKFMDVWALDLKTIAAALVFGQSLTLSMEGAVSLPIF